MMYVYLTEEGTTKLSYPIQMIMQPDAFDEDIIRRALYDIEEVYKIEGLAMYSKRHGVKSPESLSNGMKALIMLYYFAIGKYSELVANSCMGANCVPYLQELSVKYDFAIAQDYAFIVDVNKPISAYDVDTKKLFNDAEDFMLSVCGRWGALEYDWLHFDYNEYLKLKEEFNAFRST